MRKPDDIPQDIWGHAMVAREKTLNWRNDPTETIARAVLSERERCVSLIEEYADHPNEFAAFISKEIADFVRGPIEADSQ